MESIESSLQKAAFSLHGLSDSPRLDAEVLLAHVIKQSRAHLRAWPERRLETKQSELFDALIQQRRHGIPIAYLTGYREFWSREFHITPNVLIPRAETEQLVELCLELIPGRQPFRLIDLGTGSGAIAVTLAAERPYADVVATDHSASALEIARLNANKHRTHNIRFFLSDWFSDLPAMQFDLVVSNPPYIDENDIHLNQGDLRFEPKTSLISAQQGLADIRCLIDQSRHFLMPGGHLLIEHGYDQQFAVRRLFKDFGYDNVRTHFDLSGQPRVSSGQYAIRKQCE